MALAAFLIMYSLKCTQSRKNTIATDSLLDAGMLPSLLSHTLVVTDVAPLRLKFAKRALVLSLIGP